ncbi:hypothetical protein EON65_49510 [archaeon]|nr:MAG: hypothetical protein EON65_49510 [archaeon]
MPNTSWSSSRSPPESNGLAPASGGPVARSIFFSPFSAIMEFYRTTPIGVALTEALNAMIEANELSVEEAMKVLVRNIKKIIPLSLVLLLYALFMGISSFHYAMMLDFTLLILCVSIVFRNPLTDTSRRLCKHIFSCKETCW